MKLVIGISGASGVIYGIRLLEVLSRENVETHLVFTPLVEKILEQEYHRLTLFTETML